MIGGGSYPRVTVLKGSYYDIGFRMGRALRGLQVPPADEEALRLARGCEDLVSEICPSILDKVEGMVEGGEFDSRDFKAFFYARDATPQAGCTNLAVMPSYTKDGSLIVARNYDWYYHSEQWRAVREVAPDSGHRSLRITHHWAGSPDGLNDRGLGVFLAVLVRRPSAGPGLQWHVVTDILLDTCGDVQEACDLITSVPHLGAFNYLLADRHGRALVAETLPAGVTIREPQGGFILATNHLPGRESPEERLSPEDRGRQRRSLARYRRAEEMLRGKRGLVDEAMVRRLLRDHQAPICRGSHDPPEDGRTYDDVFGTIWSLFAGLDRRELLVAWGHPCRSDYRGYALS